MDISGLSPATGKLFEALEKLDSSPGKELRSPFGPSGRPDPDVVREFEQAMAGLDPSSMEHSPAPAHGGNTPQPAGQEPAWPPDSPPSAPCDAAGGVDAAGGPERPHMATETEAQTDSGSKAFRNSLDEVRDLLGHVLDGQLSPAQLYRLQYMAGMLKFQTSSGAKISQQASQGLESLLKQQG